MALPSDYISGTITLTNGSTAFTGTGTGWLAANFREGDIILDVEGGEGAVAVIASITSNTAGVLSKEWEGPTLTGVAYRMRYQWDSGRVSAQSRAAIEMLGNGNLQSFASLTGPGVPVFDGPHSVTIKPESDFVNGVAYDVQVDTLADRDAYDGQSEGFAVLVSDIGDGRSALYSKESNTVGDWGAPAYVTGPIGPMPDIEATVTSLPPGSAATVTPTPIPGGVRLDFDLPGASGFYNAGVYDIAEVYSQDDVVRHNGSSFIALQAVPAGTSPSNASPPTDTAYWQVLAAKGQDGSGTGDVVGPSGAVADRIAVFDGTTGKLIKDGGKTIAEIQPALRGHLHGFTVSNNATNPTTHVDIAPGEAASAGANPVLMVLSSVLTKRLDATWAAGSGNGGRDAGDSLANATYHVHLIVNLSTGDIDAVLSTNPAAPHVMPSGYTHSRRIWSIIRSAGTIMPFFQNGDHCVMDATTIEYNSGSARALSSLALAGVPAGIVVRPILTARNLMSSVGDVISYVAVNASSVVQLVARTQAAGGSDDNTFDFLATNTNREIFFQVSVLSGAASVVLNSKGWIDNRGRLG